MRIFGAIVLPETKPETEWIDGRAVQKARPTREHGILQLAFADALKAWPRPLNADKSRPNGAFASTHRSTKTTRFTRWSQTSPSCPSRGSDRSRTTPLLSDSLLAPSEIMMGEWMT